MKISVLFLLLQFFFNYNDLTNADDNNLVGPNDLSFLVLFEWKKDCYHFCSGSLITHRHVLTAEHCVKGKLTSDIQVRVGVANISSSKTYDIKSANSFTIWASDSDIPLEDHEHDIAILELTEEVYWMNAVPALMTHLKSDAFIGKIVTGVGWKRRGKYNRRLEKMPLIVLSDAHCKPELHLHGGVSKLMKHAMCTSPYLSGYLSKSDNGGPLMYNNELIGIHVWTSPLQSIDGISPDGSFHLVESEYYAYFTDSDDPYGIHNIFVSIEYYKYFIMSVTKDYSSKIDEEEPDVEELSNQEEANEKDPPSLKLGTHKSLGR